MNRLALAFMAVFGVAGCALTSKGDVLSVRYYAPDPARAAAAPAQGPELRLGRVRAGEHLRERIAHRDGSIYEVGYYEEKRWTERPDFYVSRELAETLFEQRGFKRVVAGDAPILDVDVLAFEEVKRAGVHEARVELRVVLSGDRDVLLEETRSATAPVDDTRGFDGVVAAMGEALRKVSDDVATRVGTAVARAAPPKPSASP